MLDIDLIKAIQSLSREVEPEQLVTMLWKIIDQYLIVTRIVVVLEEADNFFSLASISEQKSSEQIDVDFNRVGIDQAKFEVPLSIIVEQQEILFLEKIGFPQAWHQDCYLQQHNPENFIICPLKDHEIKLGFIYLENYQGSDGLSPEVKDFLEIIAQQTAIAFINLQKHQSAIREIKQGTTDLRAIIAEIVSKIGEEFFTACAFRLAEIFKADYIVVAELLEPNQTHAQTLAFLANKTFIQNFQYPLAETPSEILITEGKYQQFYGLKKSFPQDKILVELAAESYWGMVATDSNGRCIGYIAIINTEPIKIPALEAELILKALTDQDYLIILDEKGKEYTSVGFAKKIKKLQLSTYKRVIFLTGGAYGFDRSIYKRAAEQSSLSKMTFSHQMVRTFFLEQFYRAWTILNGEKYHNE